jgi:hypothetical protein
VICSWSLPLEMSFAARPCLMFEVGDLMVWGMALRSDARGAGSLTLPCALVFGSRFRTRSWHVNWRSVVEFGVCFKALSRMIGMRCQVFA